jgi:putative peptide zinc metalloprotease protein
VLCPKCHCQITKGAEFCGACGTALGSGSQALELVLPDGTRVALADTVTIGRTAANAIQLDAPSVSRRHARIETGNGRITIEDVGSSHGTWLDARRIEKPTALQPGAVIRLGDAELRVEAPDNEAAAGRTIVVPVGASLAVSPDGSASRVTPAVAPGTRPRAADGWALKRLEASEGERRWVLRDLHGGAFVRLSAADAQLFQLLDGTRTLPELIVEAERLEGPVGPGRLARLLADLGDRAMLEGVEGRHRGSEEPTSRLGQLFRPRERTVGWAGRLFDRVYHSGAWVLFLTPVLILIAFAAVAGIGVFVYLIAHRYGTPFVVASKIGLGGLVFLLGRFGLVALHECAHGLTMASYGRHVEKAGIKIVLVFPYVFVDTSQAWFEPRRRRIAISAAGPVSDLTLGAIFSVVCLAASGTVRDVFFQLAFGAYLGAFFNLNPFLDRDGYHIMVDALREPGLRRRSRAQFQRLLSGGPAQEGDTPALMRFAVAGVVWSFLAVVFAIALSTRYYAELEKLAPNGVVWFVFGAMYLTLFVPVVYSLAKPLWRRGERLPTEVRRVRI